MPYEDRFTQVDSKTKVSMLLADASSEVLNKAILAYTEGDSSQFYIEPKVGDPGITTKSWLQSMREELRRRESLVEKRQPRDQLASFEAYMRKKIAMGAV